MTKDDNIITKKEIDVISCVEYTFNNQENTLFDKVITNKVSIDKKKIIEIDVAKIDSFDGVGNPIEGVQKIWLSEEPFVIKFFPEDKLNSYLINQDFGSLWNKLLI